LMPKNSIICLDLLVVYGNGLVWNEPPVPDG
jgi:hypothetical protein